MKRRTRGITRSSNGGGAVLSDGDGLATGSGREVTQPPAPSSASTVVRPDDQRIIPTPAQQDFINATLRGGYTVLGYGGAGSRIDGSAPGSARFG